MKFVVLLVSIISFTAFAVEPAPSPTNSDTVNESVNDSSDGAIKVQKTPEHVEGITPAHHKNTKVKKIKKVKKTKKAKKKK